MKKILSLVLVLMMVLSAAAMAETVKIGVFEPASGDNGAGGKQEVVGIEYANTVVPTVNVGGVDYDIELVIVDNQSATDKAVTAAQSLVDAGVSVVLGSYGSGVSMAGGDIFAAAQIPAIGCSCTNPSVTSLCDYYWRVCFLDPFQGTVMANFAKDEFAAENAYVLSMLGDDYTTGLATYFQQAFEKMGGTVTFEQFTEGTSDFSAYLTNAANSGANVIFCPSATTYAALLIDQASSMGIEMPLLAGDTWESSVILDAAKGTNVKVFCSTFFDENDESGAASAFVSGFKAWLNENPDKMTNNGGNDIVAAVSALGYDAYMVAVQAIADAGSIVGADVAAAMPSVEIAEAVTGSIAFDDIGDAKKDMAYIKQANTETGAFDFVKTQSVADLG